MKSNKSKGEKTLKVILTKLFKEKKIFFSMDNTSRWDSLNHLRLAVVIQETFKIKLSNSEISKITDEKKIKLLLKKKLNKK